MKICSEQDCLQAHLTVIEKASRGRNPIVHRIKQSLASMLMMLRFVRENHRAGQR